MTSVEHAPTPVEMSVLEDLRARLRDYRQVDLPPGFKWARGVDSAYLTDLVA